MASQRTDRLIAALDRNVSALFELLGAGNEVSHRFSRSVIEEVRGDPERATGVGQTLGKLPGGCRRRRQNGARNVATTTGEASGPEPRLRRRPSRRDETSCSTIDERRRCRPAGEERRSIGDISDQRGERQCRSSRCSPQASQAPPGGRATSELELVSPPFDGGSGRGVRRDSRPAAALGPQ